MADAPPLSVLYEDNHCLAVVKPAGLLIAGDATGDPTLLERAKAYVKQKYAKPGDVFLGVVHRLDRPVSGVVLFARTSKAAARLSDQFRTGRVRKVYQALVEGSVRPPQGTLSDWLLKDEESNRSAIVPAGTAGAKPCRLSYRTLKETGPTTLLEVDLETGRSHQIRVQLSGRGWPVVGDAKYGSQRKGDEGVIALHAAELRFAHPIRGEEIVVSTPRPEAWVRW